MQSDNEKMLQEIVQNTEMGKNTLDEMLGLTRDQRLKNEMMRQKNEYRRLNQQAHTALAALDACGACGVKAIAGKIATGDTFVGDAATKKSIEEKCHPDCVEMEGAAVSQIAARNGVPCVILRAMSDNADESGYEVLVVKQFSIAEYIKTATEIVAHMIESL